MIGAITFSGSPQRWRLGGCGIFLADAGVDDKLDNGVIPKLGCKLVIRLANWALTHPI